MIGAAAHSVPVNCIDSSHVASSQTLRGERYVAHFLSYSSVNNAEGVALRDWLAAEGSDDTVLDTDPERGIAVGERRFNLAHSPNKRLFGVLIEDIPVVDLPANPGHPISLF